MTQVVVTSEERLRELIRSVVAEAIRHGREHEERPERPSTGWITNTDAMAQLGLSRATRARPRASGTLPYSKVGRSVYYRLTDVEALLDSHGVRP